MSSLALTLLSGSLGICRFAPTDPIPEWISSATIFLTISRTREELSIVADDAAIPEGVNPNRGYRALRVEGLLPMDLIGVVASLAAPLAAAGVPIFPIATHDTDYILVRSDHLARAVSALVGAGHRVDTAQSR